MMNQTLIKTVTATLLRADGTFSVVMPDNGKNFSLEEMQRLVGGYIELVSAKKEDMILVINEEGKLQDEWIANERATKLSRLDGVDLIAGDAIYMHTSMMK